MAGQIIDLTRYRREITAEQLRRFWERWYREHPPEPHADTTDRPRRPRR